ncbi:hypothetical protein PHJA_001223400 [Phtheirospermum japonicum]|uniref:DUF4283 domain-containing protein n=1 Tax=Phtheirospermum japonicum TaxID=374723 RepID=A0A830C621_9LAMI|nr:hypothetical protein PHJA_001223400 [Phtheirospermum japonicum]
MGKSKKNRPSPNKAPCQKEATKETAAVSEEAPDSFPPLVGGRKVPTSSSSKTTSQQEFGTFIQDLEKTPLAAKQGAEENVVSQGPAPTTTPTESDASDAPSAKDENLWAKKLFPTNRAPSHGFKLSDLNLPEDEGDDVILKEEDIDRVEASWGYCLVGYFAAKFPGMATVYEIKRKWMVPCKALTHSSGWLVFKFNSEQDRDSVLNGGPYVIYGRPLLLKVIPSCFEFDDAEVSMMPVWVTLLGLPLDCWTQNALYKIGRKIGRPLATDEVTSNKERIAFARLLVEVDVSKEP